MESELCVVKYERKVKRLLEALLDPNFVVTDDTYMNSFLSHLSGKDDKGLGDALLNLPIFVEWLITLTQYCEDTGRVPSPNLIEFILNLTSLLSKNELRFNQLNKFNVHLRLCAVLKIRNNDTSPTVKIAYINLLLSFLEHKSGTTWIISTDNWRDVLACCLVGSSTTQVLQAGYHFLYNLLVKCSTCNLVFCVIVVETIMSAFNNLNLQNDAVNDETLREKLTPTLRILSYIFVTFLQRNLASRNYAIPKLFLINYNLKQIIVDILKVTDKHEELFKDLHNIAILNHFFSLAIDLETENFHCERFEKLLAEFCKLIGSYISKGFVTNICHLCHLSQYYWKLMQPPLSKVDFNCEEVLIFESRILLFQVFPSSMISYKECNMQISNHNCDDFRDHFLTKVFKTLCVDWIRLGYNYRNFLMRDEVSLFDAALEATNYIMRTRKYYHRNTGVLAFQYYIYTLYDLFLTMKTNPEMVNKFSSFTSYFIAIFDLISTFIKEFNITWTKSVETTCLMNLTVEFISLTCWSPTIIVQAFRLLDLTISRYMSCNLALLVERSSELTPMFKLGRLLQTYLTHQECEVRLSALNIIHTISEIAVEMYPSFQNDIINFQFPSLMVTMSMNDGEKQIRATSIKCLQEMIKVPRFWCSFLDNEDLPEKMMKIIYDTKEDAIVRCEAVKLLTDLCEYRSFPDLQERINHTMLYAATRDCDWKVHENALEYWRKVIDHHLKKQGMIDGKFPDCTFSRKIVTLTEEKIRNRLHTVLEKLSKCGCLGVLVTSMQSKCDIRVLKKAVEITKFLRSFLILYKVIDTTGAVLSSSSSLNSIYLANNNNEYSDIIMDDIDNRSLANSDCCYSPIELETVSAKDFLFVIQRDLDKLVIERTPTDKQMDSLDSLLDSILKCCNNESNALECY